MDRNRGIPMKDDTIEQLKEKYRTREQLRELVEEEQGVLQALE